MSSAYTVYTGGIIFDGQQLLNNYSAVFLNGSCSSIVPDSEIDKTAVLVQLDGDILSTGYADLQVNGGGGVLLNDNPTVETVLSMSEAHRVLGTTCLLPTLISDTAATATAAIEAVKAACNSGLGSIAGLHLEGPHLSVARKGAHQSSYIRPMEQADMMLLLEAAADLPVLKITVAPENVTKKQVHKLVEAGVIVALGHTDANYATCMEYHRAGAQCVTHLYNAMSQLNSREPGLVGAALDSPKISVGLIADGVHVHPASIRTAWNIKAPLDQLYLVTDAMTPAGTASLDSFQLNGRTIRRQDGHLTLEDGTLAGADIDLTSSIRYLCNVVGVDLVDALKAAVVVPRRILGLDVAKARLLGQSINNVIRISSDFNKVSLLK